MIEFKAHKDVWVKNINVAHTPLENCATRTMSGREYLFLIYRWAVALPESSY